MDDILKLAIGAIIIVLIGLLLLSIEIIGMGEVGVVYDAGKGVLPDVMTTGWHFKAPIFQTVYHVKIARDTINMFGDYGICQSNPECDDMSISVPSKEGLEVVLDISVFYKVKVDMAIEIVEKLTPEYVKGTILPSIRSSTRDVAGGMGITELYGEGRERLEEGIYDRLLIRFEIDGFILEEVLVRDIRIPDQIRIAVEQKQKTEQEMLQKAFELEKEKLEAQRKIIEANGTAISIQVINEQLEKSKSYIDWLAVNKWDGVLPLVTEGTPFIQLPIGN